MINWTVRIGIDKTWIRDGFELQEEYLKEALMEHLLSFAYDHEIDVEILTAPDPERIKEIQNGE